MKKNLGRVFLIACFAAAAAMIFGACGYYNTKLTGQDTTYAVTSNGGSVVQYGDYVYFVNGTTSGYSDSEGDANVWGKVEKGGVYRAKLQGGRDVNKTEDGVEYKEYARTGDGRDITIKTAEATSYSTGEKLTLIDSAVIERVIPKYITFSNDQNAGIFIYGDWIYYSTPVNSRSKAGEVEAHLSEFYRTKVDGQNTQKIYTSEEDVKAYNFYHYDGKVHLVVHEGENLITVPMTGSRIGKRGTLTDGITEVMFPRKETYYKGINEDTASDYVYYTRAFDEDDYSVQGNVFERRRPDLSTGTSLRIGDNNNTYSPLSCDGDVLFFYETKPTSTNKQLIAQRISYIEVEEPALDKKGNEKKDKSGNVIMEKVKRPLYDRQTVIANVTADMTKVMAYAGPKSTAGAIAVSYAVTLENGYLVRYAPSAAAAPFSQTESDATLLRISDNKIYFQSGGSISCADLSTAAPPSQINKGSVSILNNYTIDIAAGMLWFFKDTLNQKDFPIELRSESVSANYMYIKQLTGGTDSPEYFIGVVGADELPEVEEE